MLKRWILVLVLFLPFVSAEDLSPYISVTADVKIDGRIFLDYSDSSDLDYFDAKLFFLPTDYLYQRVNTFEVSYDPPASLNHDKGIYNLRWDQNSDVLTYSINSEVVSNNLFRKIDKKIPFPYNFNEDYEEYLGEREFADINRDIRDFANQLVQGEDDYYEAVFKIAEWTRANIEYDLNTLTEKAVQKSSWVLKNRFGVCDELTNLFTSLVRAVGIPVKYVSGLAYSDAVGGWSPHAWNEVYFPEIGWVPFDITFGQYGWIDPGHVKMMEGEDAHEPSVEYSWRAYKVTLRDKEFEVNASLKEKGEKLLPLLSLKTNLLKNNLGEGSYVPVEVVIENLQPFYVSSLVYIAAAPGNVEDNMKGVLLKPYQEKKIYWLLNLNDKLEPGFKYESFVEIKDSFGSTSSDELVFAKGFERLDYKQAGDILDKSVEKEGNVKDYDLLLDCGTDKKDYYRFEKMNISCHLKNKGNIPLNFDLCLKSECKIIDLGISEEFDEGFEYDLSKYNGEKLSITTTNDNLDIGTNLLFNVYDKPILTIEDINYNNIKYDEHGEFSILMNIVPYVDNLEIDGGKIGKFSFENLEDRRNIKIPFYGWMLEEGNNIVSFTIKYGVDGQWYVTNKDISINVEKVNILRKFLVLFKKSFQ